MTLPIRLLLHGYLAKLRGPETTVEIIIVVIKFLYSHRGKESGKQEGKERKGQ